MKHPAGAQHSSPVTYTFSSLMRRIIRTPDSFPLIGALSAAATMLTGFIVYQFAKRPDFKALRISSNATPGINKPLEFHSNRLVWLSNAKDSTPSEVKELVKSLG